MKRRLVYVGAVALTIALGLGSRAIALPWWLAKNAGDALYATMIFWAIRVIVPGARAVRVAIGALAWCFAIELTQLYQAPWIDAIRATTPGHLVLGQGFNAFDLVCYVIGVALAVAGEAAVRRAGRTTA